MCTDVLQTQDYLIAQVKFVEGVLCAPCDVQARGLHTQHVTLLSSEDNPPTAKLYLTHGHDCNVWGASCANH